MFPQIKSAYVKVTQNPFPALLAINNEPPERTRRYDLFHLGKRTFGGHLGISNSRSILSGPQKLQEFFKERSVNLSSEIDLSLSDNTETRFI